MKLFAISALLGATDAFTFKFKTRSNMSPNNTLSGKTNFSNRFNNRLSRKNITSRANGGDDKKNVNTYGGCTFRPALNFEEFWDGTSKGTNSAGAVLASANQRPKNENKFLRGKATYVCTSNYADGLTTDVNKLSCLIEGHVNNYFYETKDPEVAEAKNALGLATYHPKLSASNKELSDMCSIPTESAGDDTANGYIVKRSKNSYKAGTRMQSHFYSSEIALADTVKPEQGSQASLEEASALLTYLEDPTGVFAAAPPLACCKFVEQDKRTYDRVRQRALQAKQRLCPDADTTNCIKNSDAAAQLTVTYVAPTTGVSQKYLNEPALTRVDPLETGASTNRETGTTCIQKKHFPLWFDTSCDGNKTAGAVLDVAVDPDNGDVYMLFHQDDSSTCTLMNNADDNITLLKYAFSSGEYTKAVTFKNANVHRKNFMRNARVVVTPDRVQVFTKANTTQQFNGLAAYSIDKSTITTTATSVTLVKQLHTEAATADNFHATGGSVNFESDISAVRLTKGGAIASVGFLSDDGTDYYHKRIFMTRASSQEAGASTNEKVIQQSFTLNDVTIAASDIKSDTTGAGTNTQAYFADVYLLGAKATQTLWQTKGQKDVIAFYGYSGSSTTAYITTVAEAVWDATTTKYADLKPVFSIKHDQDTTYFHKGNDRDVSTCLVPVDEATADSLSVPYHIASFNKFALLVQKVNGTGKWTQNTYLPLSTATVDNLTPMSYDKIYCRENTIYISGTGSTVGTDQVMVKIDVSNASDDITVSKINLNFQNSAGFFNGPYFYYGGDNGDTGKLMSFKGSRYFCSTPTSSQYEIAAATTNLMMRVAQLDLDSDLTKVEFSDSCIHHNAPTSVVLTSKTRAEQAQVDLSSTSFSITKGAAAAITWPTTASEAIEQAVVNGPDNATFGRTGTGRENCQDFGTQVFVKKCVTTDTVTASATIATSATTSAVTLPLSTFPTTAFNCGCTDTGSDVFKSQALTDAWKTDSTFQTARASEPTGATLSNLDSGNKTTLTVTAGAFTAAASEYFQFNVQSVAASYCLTAKVSLAVTA